jgi:hypothetical protein
MWRQRIAVVPKFSLEINVTETAGLRSNVELQVVERQKY